MISGINWAEIFSYEMIKIIMIAVGFILFDVISGLLAAFIQGDFKSESMREGGLHKLMLLMAMTFGCFLDYAMKLVDFGINVPVGRFICVYIIFMEICSIIENINKGFPNTIPSKVIKLFNTGKEDLEKEDL